jgi:conjugal transfer pilus assembly protein TraB
MTEKKVSSLTLFWDGLNPGQRRIAAIVGILAVLFIFMAMLTSGEEELVKKKPQSMKRSVLSDVNTRSIGIDALNANVKAVVKENTDLKNKVESMVTEVRDLKRRRGNDPDVTRQIAALNSQMAGIKQKAKSLGWDVQDIKEGYVGSSEVFSKDNEVADRKDKKESPVVASEKQRPVPVKKAVQIEKGLNQDPNHYFRTAPVRPAAPAPMAGAPSLKSGALEGGGLQIYTTESQPQLADAGKEKEALNMPAGTILTGVLLNGLDAATGKKARKNPFPVVVRIQHDAIMPNLFSADVKECFATLAGYGDLSSERAYLRGEKFSCITENEETIEIDFPSYAVGEDGKAGIRGRLVSKEGALIAKTALAGFLGGLAEAFGSSPVPVVQTNPSSTPLFQDNFTADTLNHGVAKGASAVAERLADYYMDLADQIFPVIEIDAGRRIDIVITSGIKLKIKES